MVRIPIAPVLILILAVCPAFCGAGELGSVLGCCAGEDQARHSSDDHRPDEAPAPCPDDGESCICAGAIPLVEARLNDGLALRSTWTLAPAFAQSISLISPLVRLHLTRNGGPTGLAGLGDPARIRALLQHIRC